MERKCIYTIGHSNLSQEEFLRKLHAYNINCVIDVRSMPASKYSPQFNKEVLESFLMLHHIHYEFFGYEFGARRIDSINDECQVDFEIASKTTLFQNGIKRFQLLPKECISAIMCTEINPLECHRFSLVAKYFHEHGYEVYHIIKEDECITPEQLEKEMVCKYLRSKRNQLSEIDELFGSYTAKDQLRDAYKLNNKEIGYRISQKELNLD